VQPGQDADALFARALEHVEAYRQGDAERCLRRALALLGDGTSPGGLTHDRVLLTLANVRAERGHVSEGLEILDRLAASASGSLVGLVHSQRAVMHLRSGRLSDALADLEAAVPLVEDDPRALAVALLNRGTLRLSVGDLPAARADLERCAGHAAAHGLRSHEAKARHNLGYALMLAGELPAALAEMDAATREVVAAGGSGDGVGHLDRARLLHAAGLLAEADAELEVAVRAFGARRSRQDQAECELGRAQIALTEGRHADALALAGSARRRFARRGSTVWAMSAELAEIRARLGLRRRPGALVARARALAAALAAAGPAEDARMAELVAVRAAVAARRRGEAVAALAGAGSPHRDDGIVTRLYARQTRAEVADAVGDRAGAQRQLRTGLRELHRYQSSFGSLDLQTAVVRHGRALAARGLTGALATGSAVQVLDWSERARALASRLVPVHPPPDPHAARLLEELRFVRSELRTVELSGRDDPALRGRRTSLERQIRQQSWYAAGPGHAADPVGMGELVTALAGRRDTALVAHLVVGSRLAALVVTPHRARVVDLGAAADVMEAVRRARADLDALALCAVPPAIRTAVARSLARGTAVLDERLWAPVTGVVADRRVVLVPSGPLVGVPWGMLAGLRGRPLCVARSASAWAAAAAAPAPGPGVRGRVLVACGPDLPRAEPEVHEVGRLWPGSIVLTGAATTGAAVLAALDGADVVHLAAHGAHEAANPLFSALRLADGPLFGYDVGRVPTPPLHVVLSACDLGLATERPGDELLGMTAALLHAGTRTVVASVARVGDEVAERVSVAYHRRVRAGEPAADALAGATRETGDAQAPFVLFGSGW